MAEMVNHIKLGKADMCILSDGTLHTRLHELILAPDHSLVNPASIDIRIGAHLKYEDETIYSLKDEGPYMLQPQEFVLVSTYEYLLVPDDLVVELKLKSTIARGGFDHSLAFHFDPGWRGIGTFEIRNNYRFKAIKLEYMMRFGQIVVNKLDKPVFNGYDGRYQHASSVEAAK